MRRITYPCGTSTSQLSLKPTLKLSWERWPVGVEGLDTKKNTAQRNEERANLHQALAGGNPGVLVWGEHAEDIVVLVDGLAIVSPLLLVPPVGVRVAELALDRGRLDVSTVLSCS